MAINEIKTTVIGSYPKPDYLKIPDWFTGGENSMSYGYDVNHYTNYHENMPADHEYKLIKAIKEIIEIQDEIGIDIVTDGEVRREHYINYHMRHLDGVDFEILTEKSSRNNAYTHLAPTIVGKIKPNRHFLSVDWQVAQLFTNKDVKVTIPGPMTIIDTFYNNYYDNEKDLLEDLAQAINYEILDLVEIGCKHIQIDEPLFARYPENTLSYGIKFIEKCFENVPLHICKIVHICCGYPDKLGQTDYPKANFDSYLHIAEAIDHSCIDIISLEDNHRPNDLELFSKFKQTSIILGVIGIANTRIESVEEIKGRIKKVLEHIPPERLIIGPDCGLAMLPTDICIRKLKNMVEATKQINKELKL